MKVTSPYSHIHGDLNTTGDRHTAERLDKKVSLLEPEGTPDGEDSRQKLIDFQLPVQAVNHIFTALAGPDLLELAVVLPFQELWARSNWIDVVVLLGLLSGLFTGAGVGFYRSTAMLLSSAVGIVLAGQFAVTLSTTELMAPVRAEMGPLLTQLLSAMAIFFSCVGFTVLATMILRSFFDKTLRICDNLLGGVMGVSLAAILMGVLILGVFQWPDSRIHEPIRSSVSGSQLADGTRQLGRFFPQEFRDRFDMSLGEIPQLGGVFAISADPASADPRD